MRIKKIFLWVLLSIFFQECTSTKKTTGTTTVSEKKATPEKTNKNIIAHKDTVPPPSKKYIPFSESRLVQIETKYGDIKIELFCAAPRHRDNFIKLISQGYYNDLLFHRVIRGFMMQGGDPSSRFATKDDIVGGGDVGYTIEAEINEELVHTRGALAAARDDNPTKASSGGQFYIVHGRKVTDEELSKIEREKGFIYTAEQRAEYLEQGGTPQLDQEYTVFGKVYEGIEVVDKIVAQATNNRDRPLEDIKMKIKILK